LRIGKVMYTNSSINHLATWDFFNRKSRYVWSLKKQRLIFKIKQLVRTFWKLHSFNRLSVDQKMAVSATGPCAVATTSLQPKPYADLKKQSSAKSYGR
jgi:hypothetical protein